MAGLGGSMMAPPVLEGSAESGCGASLAGFHCSRSEYLKRLEEFNLNFPDALMISTYEDNGFICFVAARFKPMESFPVPSKSACFIREPHKFFRDLPAFLRSTRARIIDSMALSGSLGSVTLTLLYRGDA